MFQHHFFRIWAMIYGILIYQRHLHQTVEAWINDERMGNAPLSHGHCIWGVHFSYWNILFVVVADDDIVVHPGIQKVSGSLQKRDAEAVLRPRRSTRMRCAGRSMTLCPDAMKM